MTVSQRRMKKVSMLLVFLFIFSLVGPYLPLPGATGAGIPTAKAAEPQTIGDLQIGDKVVDNSWEWEHRPGPDTWSGVPYSGEGPTKPVTWIVVAKDHYGAGSGVTLLSEEIIARHTFDNSTDRGSDWSNNHWGDSGSTNATYGIRKFLNGSSYDYAGGYGGTYSGAPDAEGDGNTYAVTFYDAFSSSFQDAVITTTVPCRANNNTESPYDDEEYTTLDRVFMPSQVELNGATGHNHSSEVVWPYFDGADNADRIAMEANGNPRYYWTRSPFVAFASDVRLVSSDGGLFSNNAYDAYVGGVRPALNLFSGIPVSGISNSDGVYEILGGVEDVKTTVFITPQKVYIEQLEKKITIFGGLLYSYVIDEKMEGTITVTGHETGDVVIPSNSIEVHNNSVLRFKLPSTVEWHTGLYGINITHPNYEDHNLDDIFEIVDDDVYREKKGDKLEVGQITLSGEIEEMDHPEYDYKVGGNVLINGVVGYKGEPLMVNMDEKVIKSDGQIYITTSTGRTYNIISGKYDLNGNNSLITLLPSTSFNFEVNGVKIEIENIRFDNSDNKNGILIEKGTINLPLASSGRQKRSLNFEVKDLKIHADGLDFYGKIEATGNVPMGIMDLRKAYIELDTINELFGGGLEVFIRAIQTGIEGAFNMDYRGRLNYLKVGVNREIPILVPTPPVAALSNIGFSVDNLAVSDPVEFSGSLGFSDLITLPINGNRLLNASGTATFRRHHFTLEGDLSLYTYKMAGASFDHYANRGIDLEAWADLNGWVVGDFYMCAPDVPSMQAYIRGAIQIPETDEGAFLGGTTLFERRMDYQNGKLVYNGWLWDVQFDFNEGSIRLMEETKQEGFYQNKYDDMILTIGRNFSHIDNSYSLPYTSSYFIQNNGLHTILKHEVGGKHQAVAIEITSKSNEKVDFAVLDPVGNDYELISGTIDDDYYNFMQNEEGGAALIFLLPEDGDNYVTEGDWLIKSNRDDLVYEINTYSVDLPPEIKSATLSHLEGTKYQLDWEINSPEDTKVEIFLGESPDEYLGYLIHEEQHKYGEKGSHVFDLSDESLPSGEYWVFIKSEREDVSPTYYMVEESIKYNNPLTPLEPKNLSVVDISNGSFTIDWEPVNGKEVTEYLLCQVDEDGLPLYDLPYVYIPGDENTFKVTELEPGKEYSLALVAVWEESDEDVYFSEPSNQIDVFIPTPNPPELIVQWHPLEGDKKIVNYEKYDRTYIGSNKINLNIDLDQDAVTDIYINENLAHSTSNTVIGYELELQEGYNLVEIEAINEDGDEANSYFVLYVDTIPPVLYVESPSNGDIIEEKSILIKGNTEPGAVVTLNNKDITVGTDGNFSGKIYFDDFIQEIILEANDPAGNSTIYKGEVINPLYDLIEATEAVNKLFVDVTSDELELAEGINESDIENASVLVTNLFESEQKDELQKLIEYAYSLLHGFVFGDVGGTGEVTVSDAILVLRHIVGLLDLRDYNDRAFERAKVSGDDELTVGDAVLILRYIVGLINKFPVE